MLIITLGVYFVATVSVVRLNREWHLDALMQRAGRGGRLVAGAAFAVAWTPLRGTDARRDPLCRCAVKLGGARSSTPSLLSAGLAIPFLATALAFERMTSLLAVIRRHFRVMIAAGGVVLIGMGALIWSGELFQLNIQAQNALNGLGINFFNSL